MTIFEKIKAMNIDELAEWIDKNGDYNESPWINWWNDTYCKRCESEFVYSKHFGRDVECAWCEVNEKCRFFQEIDEVPNCKQIIKMWLESETLGE